MIDKLKGIGAIDNTSRTESIQRSGRINDEDRIVISAESQRLSEAYLAKKIAMSAPDIREDKVTEMRQKFEDPLYLQKAIEAVADKLLSID